MYTHHNTHSNTAYIFFPHTVRSHLGKLELLYAWMHSFSKSQEGLLQLLQALIVQHPIGCYHSKTLKELYQRYGRRQPADIFTLAPGPTQDDPEFAPGLPANALHHTMVRTLACTLPQPLQASDIGCAASHLLTDAPGTPIVTEYWLKQYQWDFPSTTLCAVVMTC